MGMENKQKVGVVAAHRAAREFRRARSNRQATA